MKETPSINSNGFRGLQRCPALNPRRIHQQLKQFLKGTQHG